MGASTRSTNSRRKAALAAIVLVLLLAAAPAGRAAPAAKQPAPQATVFFCDSQDIDCRLKRMITFDVTKVRDLWVFVAWKNLPAGVHRQDLRFALRRGEHYQTLTTFFSTVGLPGLPANVQIPKQSQGDPTVFAVLPVGGTWITQHTLTGMWEVEVFLDGQSMTKAKFQLHEPD
jgi:hypothetical protein